MQHILSTLAAVAVLRAWSRNREEHARRSISRLHDDELACVLPFLSLTDLAQLVRCSRRFCAVAHKERSHCRGLHLKGGANIVPPSSSTLKHHVASLHLERPSDYDAPLTRDVLHQLRGLPRLTALQLTLADDAAVNHLMQGLSADNAAAELRAVVPLQLRSFRVTAGSWFNPLREPDGALATSFWAAVSGMTQLTELDIEQHPPLMHAQTELTQLLHLRKLTLGPAREMGEHVAELKQLSQLRELTLHEFRHDRVRLLLQPPHLLQLESLTLPSLEVDIGMMRALIHLPTLTSLNPSCISHDAWPLLPQLPLLRRLSLRPYESLSPGRLASLCASLSSCVALEDLTLRCVSFDADDGALLTAEQERAGWAELLCAVPHLRRLCVWDAVLPFLSVLPLHLPVLEELSLSGWSADGEDHFARVAHSTIGLLEVEGTEARLPSDEEMQACRHSERMPKLERCVRHVLPNWPLAAL
jgi:hypothetical protein